MVTPAEELKTYPLSPREVADLVHERSKPHALHDASHQDVFAFGRILGRTVIEVWRLDILRIILGRGNPDQSVCRPRALLPGTNDRVDSTAVWC